MSENVQNIREILKINGSHEKLESDVNTRKNPLALVKLM